MTDRRSKPAGGRTRGLPVGRLFRGLGAPGAKPRGGPDAEIQDQPGVPTPGKTGAAEVEVPAAHELSPVGAGPRTPSFPHTTRVDYTRQPLAAQWDPTAEATPALPPAPPTSAPARLRQSLSRYGWRMYLLPALLVITVLVGVDAVRAVAGGHDAAPSGPHTGGPGVSGIVGAPPKGDGKYAAGLPSGLLPTGGPVAETGTGTWHVVPGGSAPIGAPTGRLFTYSVEIEDGIDTTSLGGDAAVASMVEATLANPKSWIHDPHFAFQRVDHGAPDFRVSLTSRATTKEQCGFEIPIDSSCYNESIDRVVLSEARWVRGALAFDGDIGSYRQYQINHEVGHAIGYRQHQPCPADGVLAPVMMQQTFGTRNNDIAVLDPQGVVPMDGKQCRFNPWPYPAV
ncbi:DUF3152 domain-containing protein [Nocardia stercoris]|uniref:DUF3152 domain-containing protein n=1 Tax=Nocardia stercoris TaxID=2483361 RepID=UPI001F1B75C1|nr:DUF3152 domain-containing protein [Nocardia stercoris]